MAAAAAAATAAAVASATVVPSATAQAASSATGTSVASQDELDSLKEMLEDKRREKARESDQARSLEIDKEIDILARWLEERQASAAKPPPPPSEAAPPLPSAGAPRVHGPSEATPSSPPGRPAARAPPEPEAVERDLRALRDARAEAEQRAASPPVAGPPANSAGSARGAAVVAGTGAKAPGPRPAGFAPRALGAARAGAPDRPAIAPASAVAEDYFVVPPVGDKMPPCKLPTWCVIPNPDDIVTGVEILRRTIGGKVAPKRLLFGKRAWVLLGRRLKEADARLASGPEPDVGLATARASRSHALAMRNWKGQVFLMDLGSANGTFLDKQKLPQREAIRWNVGSTAYFADASTEIFELRPAG